MTESEAALELIVEDLRCLVNDAAGKNAAQRLLLSQITEMVFDPYEDIPNDDDALLERVKKIRTEWDAMRAVSPWTKAADAMPPAGLAVLAYVPDAGHGGRRLRAVWVEQFSCVAHEEAEPEDCDERNGEYYVRAGWYEFPWYSEESFRITDPVTHWMRLPEARVPE